jgi:Uma2 family endonuclease
MHAAVESNIVADLKIQGERRGLGKARSGDVGIILWRNPDRVVGADAAFITNVSLPLRRSREGYLETIPELVVEVRSKNDSQPEVDQKIRDYLTAGVKVAWVPDPDTQTVTEYRSGQPPRVYTVRDTLTVDDIIPGFRMPVSQVFEF